MSNCFKCGSAIIELTGRWRSDKVQYKCYDCGHVGWSKRLRLRQLHKKMISNMTVIYVLGFCKNCGSHAIYHELKCCINCGYKIRLPH